ncbi:probable chitinase 10 [Diabrotica virgifera virgifera]|uniref:chitinase n=1 Tax=Diabrotica virgifera virgifera TaxID=50390 RepID=A0A6P7F7S4_DIAVI|nr:probable chitinase 10 [Diabrotica virgifera virgifera]
MRKEVILISLLLLCVSLTEERATRTKTRIKRDSHMPPPGVPSFRRDSVEHVPKDKNLAYSLPPEYGSVSLPLRAAVESIPNILENSRRLPLRDAVEKRPPPDEALDLQDGLHHDSTPTGQVYLSDDSVETQAYNPPQGGYNNVFIPGQYYPYQYSYTSYQDFPNYQFQTPYSQLQYFQGIISDYRKVSPYRIDNGYQQLIVSPFGLPYGRSLRDPLLVAEQARSDKGNSNEQKIVCYVEGVASYRKEPLAFNPEDLDPYICTHVIYNYATIDPISYTITSNDEEYDVVQGGYKATTSLRQKNPNLNILISLGGSKEDGSHRFSNMVSNARKRMNFIQSVISFLNKYDFDGMEVHWDYPGAEESGGQITDKEFLALFLEETAEIFRQKKWELVLSAPASRFKIEDGFDPMKVGDIVDFVNVQAYDFHLEREAVADHPANLFARPEDNGLNIFLSVDYAVQFWLRKGLPSSKLILGIPFYGRSFTLKYSNETEIGSPIIGPGREGFYTKTPGLLAYFEICEMFLNEGWFKSEDASGSPYMVNGDQWVGYDDLDSIKRKVDYAKEHNLGGIAVNAADFDDFKGLCGPRWPLMTLVNSEIKGVNPTFLTDAYTKPTKPFGVCDSSGYYSDSSNCAAFYVCKNGLIYHLSCGQNLMFNPTNGKCDHVNPEMCRPGETVFLASSLKEISLGETNLIKENLEDDRAKVVCYVTNWAFYRKGEGKFVPEHIDQRLCTHVVYAFASLDPEKLLVKEFDPWADLDNNLYERITSLKDTTVLLSLGGWTDSTGDKYSRLVSDGSARRRFVVGVVGFLRRHKFRGLHFDWNYPTCWQSNCKRGPSTDKTNFAKIIQELRKEFDKQSPPLVLAAAISGYKEVIDLAYDLPTLGANLDFFSVMSYDYHGAWEGHTGHVSPLYGKPTDKYPQYNVNFTMEYLVSKGAPRQKLLLGVPFYGQSFSLMKKSGYDEDAPSNGPGEPGEYTRQPGLLAYYEICNRIKNQRWTAHRSNRETGPYAYNVDQWVGYEDVMSVKEKATYIKSRGFGGAVAWTIDLDDFNNRCCEGSFPLLKSLNRELGLIADKPTQSDCTKPPQPSTPAPPETTTGIDSGASNEHNHHHEGQTSQTTQKTTTAPWWTTKVTTTKAPSTTAWWETPSSTNTWWSTQKTTTVTKTTKKPTTTQAWWMSTKPTPKPTTTKKPVVIPPEGSVIIPPPTVVRPELDPTAKKCEAGHYQHDPMNCNAFYRCVAGELTKQYCAGGLHWNRNKNVCDWPAEARCMEMNPGQPPTKKPTKKPTTTSWQTTRQTQTTPTTRRPTVASIKPPIDSSCDSGAYYPHEQCNQFYVCFNNHLVQQTCPPGLNFHAEKGMCDWTFKVKCSNRKKMAEKYTVMHDKYLANRPQPYSRCEGNSFAPLPGSCSQFMHCQWNKYEIMQCAPGLHWNNEKRICDWPQAAHCSEESETNDIDAGESPSAKPEESTLPPWHKPTTVSPYPEWSPPSTTKYPEWTPPSTTQWTPSESNGNEWEWHPPIPPTSEKPPLPEPLKPLSGYFKVVCYFTNWAWYRQGYGKYLPEDIDENLCTHVVYGFAVLDYSNYVIKAHDSWADFDNQFYKRVVEYKAKGVKVSIAIGGWNDSLGDKYSKLVNNPAARRRFIEHVLKFLEKHNFDGLDLDWEYPKCWQVDCKKGPDSDKPAFAEFVKELKEAFKPKGYLLTAAVSPSKTVIDAGYDVPSIAENLDWVAVMTYDFHGQWDKKTGHVAPLFYHPDDEVAFFNSNFSVHYWISEGVPRRKLIMGMPLYGQSFRLEKESENGLNANAPGPGEAGEYTRAAGFLAYYEICDMIKNRGYTVVQDPTGAMGPYAYKGNQWLSFDDQAMIRKKSEYIRRMDLGGGMIWALDLDDFKDRCGQGRHPLLTIIRNTLADPGTGEQEPIDDLYTPAVQPAEAVEIEEEKRGTTHSEPLVDASSEYKVVCYFTNWAWYRQGVGKYLPQDIDPDLCTHIVYGFAVLNTDELVIKPHDSWADFDNKFYEKVTALKAKGIKVLIAIGGWNDSAGDKYSKLVNSPSARRRFVTHVVDFIEQNNFDGLDLDWEYPKCWQVDCKKGPSSDKEAFSELVKELYEAFQPKGLLLSAAVSPSKRVIDEGYDVPLLSKYLDWIAVMCYDYHGQWDKVTGHVSPMYEHPEDSNEFFNTNYTMNYWIEKGADRKKLVMGMPTYGQSFSLSDNKNHGLNVPTYGGGEAGEETRARGFLAYYEICRNIIQKDWTVVRDKKGRMGPYAYHRDQWVSFDDIGVIRHKSEYIRAMGLGGGMIWALDLDDFKNLCGCEEYPLLKTINRVLRNYRVPDPRCVLGKKTENPTTKPSIQKPTTKPPVHKPTVKPPVIIEEPDNELVPTLPCDGQLFVPHPNCNQYYLCNQGELQLQSCPSSLYWNVDHCDWPENTQCHPDGSTLAPVDEVTESSLEFPEEEEEPPVVDNGIDTPSGGTDLSEQGNKVICYFTNWAWYRQGDGKYLPSDIDPNLCTHINYGFAVLDPHSLTIKPHDSWADIDNEFYKKVVEYKSKGIKVLIAIGGWNDSLGDKYSRLVNNPQARARFVANVIEFIEKYGFDGLDLDWEYPKCWQVDCEKGPASDKQGFAALVRELSFSFRSKGLLLSSAVSPSKAVIDAGYDVPTLSRYFDWIGIMTYDFHGHWDKQTGHVAPLYYYPGDTYDYFNANFSVNYWISKGAPPEKLILGFPLYGQSFSLADPGKRGLNEKTYGPGEAGEFTRAGGFLSFYEICERVRKQGWTVTRDPEGRIGPYATHGNQWVSYDDISEVKRKAQLVKDLGLGGGMIWALDLDDFRNRCGCGKHPLLKTLNKELRGIRTDIYVQNCT